MNLIIEDILGVFNFVSCTALCKVIIVFETKIFLFICDYIIQQ